MTQVLGGLSMSLDGYVESVDGESGMLYVGFDMEHPLMVELTARTGAVVMGRRSFDAPGDPDSYAADYEFQVPLFVVTSSPPATPPASNDRLSVTFVPSPTEAVAAARAAAGELDVTVVGGPTLMRSVLREGLLDVLEVDVVPLFLGGGVRFFDDSLAGVRLEKAYVHEMGPRTTLGFRCLRGSDPSP